MTAPSRADPTAPRADIRVRGVPLVMDAASDVMSVSVHLSTELPGMCTIRLWDWDPVQMRPTWSDSAVFEPGAPVEVRLGYENGPRPKVFGGEITGVEVEMGESEPSTVTVRCYDLAHRLMRGQYTRTFVQMTDSAIAGQIATERGLVPVVTTTDVRHEHVLQYNQTDLEFLSARAEPIDYEVLVDDGGLVFRPRRRERVLRAVLARDDLLDMRIRLTTMGRTGALAVQGRSVLAPGTQVQAVRNTVEPNPVRGSYRTGTATTIRPISGRAEADAVADAQLDRIDPWRIVGSGSCLGRPELVAGDLVQLNGFGSRFSGDYVVTAVVHGMGPSRGYVTSFDVRKDPV